MVLLCSMLYASPTPEISQKYSILLPYSQKSRATWGCPEIGFYTSTTSCGDTPLDSWRLGWSWAMQSRWPIDADSHGRSYTLAWTMRQALTSVREECTWWMPSNFDCHSRHPWTMSFDKVLWWVDRTRTSRVAGNTWRLKTHRMHQRWKKARVESCMVDDFICLHGYGWNGWNRYDNV